jgi:Lon protease-like protein
MSASASYAAVPLFPLSNVVLFPRAVLPLHIFEERYKSMTADALRGDRRVAMALLKSGWEKCQHQKPAIAEIVCVGEILTWERLACGEYNFLLQGRARARIVREIGGELYRRAELQPLEETPILEINLERDRGRMVDLFTRGALGRLPISRQFVQLLEGLLPTAEVADLAAFTFLEDVGLKQELLAELNVGQRVGRVIDELQRCVHGFNPALHGLPADPGMN